MAKLDQDMIKFKINHLLNPANFLEDAYLPLTSQLRDDVLEWLEANNVKYDLVLKSTMSIRPSHIKIFDSNQAMLFKLTWM